MNSSELAQKMLEWEQTQTKADALALEIRDAVLALGKTQNVGNVRASYSAGRKSYDYETAISMMGEAGLLLPDVLKPYETVIPEIVKTDYRAACKGMGVEDIPFTQSEPSVSIKFVK